MSGSFTELIVKQGDTPEKIMEIMEDERDCDDIFTSYAFSVDGEYYDDLSHALDDLRKKPEGAQDESDSDSDEEQAEK